MSNMVAKLKHMDDDLELKRVPLVHLVMASSLQQFDTFVVNYNMSPEKWDIEKIIAIFQNLLGGLTQEREAIIKKQLQDPELSPSPYDTAWVAMVPLRGFPQTPCFPQCVDWILQNQRDDGSWGISELVFPTSKSVLLSTLACVVALKKWDVGAEHIRRGLQFIGKNFSIAMDERTSYAPIGFNITFPGMVSLAMGMGLEFPVRQNDLDVILHIQQMELKSFSEDKSYGREAYMAYVAEGIGNLLDWNEVMKFQRKNGSLFNSPSTTAAALIYYYDDKALQYLKSLLSAFGCAAPTVYPINVSCQLLMVDSLEKIGISRHFSNEIKSILDVTHSLWLQRDEEIMLDVATCAMAFRILRMNGYDVSSGELYHVADAANFHNSLQGYLHDTKSLLELYKASNASISKTEMILDNIGAWSGSLLMEQLCSYGVQKVPIFEEVEYALKFPFYATMERLEHKRNIETFDIQGYQMLKTEYLPCRVNKDLLALAIEDFTFSQFIYQRELLHIESWVQGNRLDQLRFARQRQTYCYLAAAATIFPPELSDTRISWVKNAILTTIVDDFFDIGGSKEELENLITLVEMWDEHQRLKFHSDRVQIVFRAIYATVNQLAVVASAAQNRDVRKHLIEVWIYTLKSMMTEAEWTRVQYVPTIDEYMTNAKFSYALGPIVLPSLYFLGQELSMCVVEDQEYDELFSLMSTCCRLLNDIQGFEREGKQGKVNSVSLYVLDSGGSLSTEAAKKAIHDSIALCRRDLLKLVLMEDSVVPRPCKELFWKMCKINHLFYSQTDGYSSPEEMISTVNAVIYEPLKLQISDPSLLLNRIRIS
ncbi:ent-kaur-16-ene synthase, chloroplastic-like [Lolium rigidum]|uniref:ent-kaur-16-ene synthase, chloroplastic-like n=1 Tax=Lolium rigidum TaxID=89674 RepID=UPI001F5CCB25|nr:ent-kaur-16-ene synthase, chloroplastic-like [Lolium rigidum]